MSASGRLLFLLRYPWRATYNTTSFNDPFLHEARVRLNRRDHYLRTAGEYEEGDIEAFRRRMTIAHFENKMIEKYFPETLSRSVFLLPAETVQDMNESALSNSFYERAVSKHLLPMVNERQVLMSILALAVCLLLVERRLSRGKKT